MGNIMNVQFWGVIGGVLSAVDGGQHVSGAQCEK